MKRLLAVIIVSVLASSGFVHANGIEWNCAANWRNYSNGVTQLVGGTDGSVGCFVQLLWVGANGIIDSAVNSGNGVGSSDDVVLDWNYVGYGLEGADGMFNAKQLTEGGNIVSNRDYFIRVWSAPASDFASGYVPTSSTNMYGNSSVWTYPSSSPSYDTFDGTALADINTTLTAVPEPAMFGLAIVGLLSVRLFGRKRK